MSSTAISRTALRARPLALAQSPPPIWCSVRRLAADVAGDLVELVGGHEEPVARAGRACSGAYSITRYSRVAPPIGALHHLDEPADAVLLVHDVVAGAQLQRVDDVARGGWAVRRMSLVAARRAGEVGLGEQREPQLLGDEAVLEPAPW